jgi:hypothetical protein
MGNSNSKGSQSPSVTARHPVNNFAVLPSGEWCLGKFGAVSLMLYHAEFGLFLQHFADENAWDIPSTTFKSATENPLHGALRAVNEGANVRLRVDAIEVLFSEVMDKGLWKWTTFAAELRDFRPENIVAGKAENGATLKWVPLDRVEYLELHKLAHPDFREICDKLQWGDWNSFDRLGSRF